MPAETSRDCVPRLRWRPRRWVTARSGSVLSRSDARRRLGVAGAAKSASTKSAVRVVAIHDARTCVVVAVAFALAARTA